MPRLSESAEIGNAYDQNSEPCLPKKINPSLLVIALGDIIPFMSSRSHVVVLNVMPVLSTPARSESSPDAD
jgi:hypothetical protein